MARAYKWLGGIGYILGLIPYIGIVSPILIAIAWILMGKDTREKIFTAFGALMLVLIASVIVFITWLFLSFMMIAYAAVPGALGLSGMGVDFGQIWGLIAAGFAIVGLAIAVFILDIIAHLRAGKIFNSRWFKIAGWMRIILIIVLVIAIPLTIFAIISAGTGLLMGMLTLPELSYSAIMSLLLTIFWPLIIVMIVSLLATIFSIISFFTIPEETPSLQPASQPSQP